jgi:hypothetical protein
MNESYEELLRARVRYRFEVERGKIREEIKDEKIKNLNKANWTLAFEVRRLKHQLQIIKKENKARLPIATEYLNVFGASH